MAVKFKEFLKSKDLKIEDNGEALNVSRGGGERIEISKSVRSDNSKVKYFNCKKICHFKRDCPERKVNENSVEAEVALGEESYEDAEALLVSSLETEDSWVIDSGFSYHMCPRIEYFETLKMVQGEVVPLGDNKACTIHGIGTLNMEFPTIDASSSEKTVTKITDYQLTHDDVRRVIVASQMEDYASLGYYV
ncbi:uncharacterized protein LOC131633408 [Vicia villosa]|uniref:uncharacterized protein LOC131633408 n=1 Tax=Vicia villosa TaxID=3911 RepID=UPI00273B4FCE|nr:uncharacterized protein LOC131633408 [Vicia villosa]